jgi:hypothetical protein
LGDYNKKIGDKIMLKRKVGIEIEFLGDDREYGWDENSWSAEYNRIKKAIAKKINIKLTGSGNNNKHWILKDDCSVEDYNNYNRPGFEISTPPLKKAEDFKKLRALCRTLKNLQCDVNDTCGLHVHVDTKGLTPYQIVAIVDRYNKLVDEIEDFFEDTRIDNEYCADAVDTPRLGMQALLARTRRNFKDCDLGHKYCKVNVSAFGCHGTIEFRQHHGTLNASQIIAWARFCVNFVEQTKKEVAGHKPNMDWKPETLRRHQLVVAQTPWFANNVPTVPGDVAEIYGDNIFPAWKGSALKGLYGSARKTLLQAAARRTI